MKRFTPDCWSRQSSAPAKDVAWVVTRLGTMPAKYVVRVYAPDEKTAIARRLRGITIPQLQQKLAARRE